MGLQFSFAFTLLVIGGSLLLVSDHSWAFKKKYHIIREVPKYSFSCYGNCLKKPCFCVDTAVCHENPDYIMPGKDRRPRKFNDTITNCTANEICCPVLKEDHWETLKSVAKSDVVSVKRCCESGGEMCYQDGNNGDFPWMLAVYKPKGKFLFGAVLFQKDWAVTHLEDCKRVERKYNLLPLKAQLGGRRVQEDQDENRMVKVEKFECLNGNFNFALLKLETDSTKNIPVVPIAPSETTVPYTCCAFLEWGSSKPDLTIHLIEPNNFTFPENCSPSGDKLLKEHQKFGVGPLICIEDYKELVLLGVTDINTAANKYPIPFCDVRQKKFPTNRHLQNPFEF